MTDVLTQDGGDDDESDLDVDAYWEGVDGDDDDWFDSAIECVCKHCGASFYSQINAQHCADCDRIWEKS